MDNVATFFGWFCLAMLALAVACAAVAWAAYAIQKALERFEFAVDAKVRATISRNMGSASTWFTESNEAYLALKIASEHIRDGYAFDPSNMRQQWRRECSSGNGRDKP